MTMKRMVINGHVITFEDNGQQPNVLSDRDYVRRLLDLPDVSEELRALARLVLELSTEREENTHGSIG